MKSGSLALAGLALLFSLLSFIVMATNNRGDGIDFNRVEAFRWSDSFINYRLFVNGIIFDSFSFVFMWPRGGVLE
jgi:hypothetical protein